MATPVATIDSPSAMIMNRPWRSEKCPGLIRHVSRFAVKGPMTLTASASTHST
jgi:hypothetical protein